ncbi:hypothetical protein [Chthonobacter rhizosphaerae]|uniref:hypothetical protein n=1 Tax=Chthonobacter rhizosphaerae TaxID=2735553 RepID=UPI0015EE8289|nr:hypothetical protein [Chthonobacter rhizosphaerae]
MNFTPRVGLAADPWQPIAFMPVHAHVDVRDANGVIARAECRKVGTPLVYDGEPLPGPAVAWRWPARDAR